MNKKHTGVLIAAALGTLFATAAMADTGMNSSQSTAAPQATATNSCSGKMNNCKDQNTKAKKHHQKQNNQNS